MERALLECAQGGHAAVRAGAVAGEAFLDAAVLAQYHVDVEVTRRAGRAFVPLGAHGGEVAVGGQPTILVGIELHVVPLEESQQVFLQCRAVHSHSRGSVAFIEGNLVAGRSRQVRYRRRSNSRWW